MQISERTIKRLGQIITGDTKISPYRSGPQLVTFFNEFGCNDVYGKGFPSRWTYAESCIRKFNNSPNLRKIIISALDPRDFLAPGVWNEHLPGYVPADINEAINYLNEFLDYDGYEIVVHGKSYDIIDKTRGEILFDIKLEPTHLSHQFIKEQIEKCRTKTSQDDYDGAITNARSLVEAVLIAIEKEFDNNVPSYDGNLPKLYKRIQKHLNLSPDNESINQSLKQTLTGFISIIDGLSGLSNKMGDRHAREYKPSKHHAVLLVNAAMTLSNFIFDTFSYQHSKS
jgi:hypothetical protein